LGPRHVLYLSFVSPCLPDANLAISTLQTDYEQQRLHLLRKHGIDLEDSLGDGTRTKRMERKDVELLMGGDGQGRDGLFTWREKNRRKVR
jgi:hypothetical protein